MTPRQTIRRIGGIAGRLTALFRMDPQLVFRAITWRITLPALKYLMPLPGLVRLMWRRPHGPVCGSDARRRDRVQSVQRLFAEGGRLLISRNCLERSLVAYRFLAEGGASPHLVMGVSTGVAGVNGHVWIELEDRPFADTGTGGFTPIVAFGAAGQSLLERVSQRPLNVIQNEVAISRTSSQKLWRST